VAALALMLDALWRSGRDGRLAAMGRWCWRWAPACGSGRS
jgi:hypothetical protein